MDPNKLNMTLLVPYFSKDGEDFRAAIPALESYLKDLHPQIEEVEIWYRNPVQLPDTARMAFRLVEAALLFRSVKPSTDKIMSKIEDDAHKWLKRRFKVRKMRRWRGTTKSRTYVIESVSAIAALDETAATPTRAVTEPSRRASTKEASPSHSRETKAII